MKVSSDYYSHIGHEHVVSGRGNQDHALSVARDGLAGIVISDGCSDGRETDMGARIITFSTISSILQCQANGTSDALQFQKDVVSRSKAIREASAESLALLPRDLLATRVHAVVTETFAYVHMEGDGVIAWLNDEVVTMVRYDWAHNTPCYPSYDSDDFGGFISAQGSYEEQGLVEVVMEWSKEEGFTKKSETHIPISEGVRGVSRFWRQDEFESLSLISVMSDGVTRVSGLPWEEVVLQSLSFKNMTGEFLKRRFIRMHKEWSKNDIVPLDDIACATMYLDQRKGETYDDT